MRFLTGLFSTLLFCVPGIIAALISARLAKTSKEEWALMAWVPSLPLLGLGIYLGVVTARDSTAANLWPFVMVFFIGLTAILFGVFVIARKFFGSKDSTGPSWRR
jgi:hypothetical protein